MSAVHHRRFTGRSQGPDSIEAMDDGRGWNVSLAYLAVAITAYLGFAVTAGFSVRPDGSTRWPALVVGALMMAVAAASLIASARTDSKQN